MTLIHRSPHTGGVCLSFYTATLNTFFLFLQVPQATVSQVEVKEVPVSPPAQPVAAKEEPAPSAPVQVLAKEEPAPVPACPKPEASACTTQAEDLKDHEPHLGPRPRSHNRVLNPPGGKSSVVFY